VTDYCNKRSPASAEQPERADPRILLSLELLQGKRLDAKGLVEISAQLHMSPSRWRHLFKRDTGLPPARWYKLRRMRQAKQLLEESFLSVKEIASIVDFADVSHFVRDFKNIYGRTPKQVRIVRLRTLTGGRETIEGSSMG
jgi:AraC-like DNA-binding protein